MKVEHCAILGGGLAGLTLADRLSDAGIKVTLIEREADVGGLARRVRIDGSSVDFGPHNLRVQIPEILAYWQELLGDDLEKRIFQAQIYFRGSLLSYPIKPFQLMARLSPALLVWSALGLLKKRLSALYTKPTIDSFEDWLRQNYGDPLYQVFFRPFTEKIWGLPPAAMDSTLARQRIPPFSLLQTLLRLKPTGQVHSEDPRNEINYYPRHGVYQICEAILARLAKKQVVILRHTDVNSIDEGAAVHLDYRNLATGATGRLTCDFLASSISVVHLLKMYGEATDDALANLRYRGLGILYLSVPESCRTPSDFTLCAEQDMPFSRITDFRSCSDHLSPPGKNVLGIEFAAKSSDPDALKLQEQEIIAKLRAAGFVDLSIIYATKIELAPLVYPVYLKGYKDFLASAFAYCSAKQRLLTFGRHGVFSHINIDHVMDQAFKAARLIAAPTEAERRAQTAEFYR